MITFAGVSSEKSNKYLRYTTSYNKSNISNINQKLSIQHNAKFPFYVNTTLIRVTQKTRKNKLTNYAFRAYSKGSDREVIILKSTISGRIYHQ
jgi:hypothetical protein